MIKLLLGEKIKINYKKDYPNLKQWFMRIQMILENVILSLITKRIFKHNKKLVKIIKLKNKH